MHSEEEIEYRRQISREMEALRQEVRSFKKRLALLVNLVVPGLGFILYGRSYGKGLVCTVFAVSYAILYGWKILPNTGGIGIQALYASPLLAVWGISLAMVAGLEE